MLRFLYLVCYCLKNRLDFFSYSAKEKADLLSRQRLSFLAGLYYLDLKDYQCAAQCFLNCKAYRHLMLVYQKQGLYSKAIEIAEKHRYYKQGAKLCMHTHNIKKAGFFYSFFEPLFAAKLYRSEHFYYEAGMCYLKGYDPQNAIDCFYKSSDTLQKQKGLKRVSEYGLVLYFTRQYEEAFKIFIALDDYDSALDCAYAMKEETLIASTKLLIAAEAAKNQNFILAAQYIENILPEKASFYYACAHQNHEVIRLLIHCTAYDKAINLCLVENDIMSAYQIALKYNPPLSLDMKNRLQLTS